MLGEVLARLPVRRTNHGGATAWAKRIGKQLKSIWMADDLAKAETALAELVASYRESAPRLAD